MGETITSKERLSLSKDIPENLIYEELNGKPIYYRGYRDVIEGHRTLEDIMGSSSLQGLIISVILKMLYQQLDEETYTIFTNEIGIHIAKGTNFASDIAIFSTNSLKDKRYDNHYIDIPPQIVIEVDSKAELPDNSPLNPVDYIHVKTQRLLDFGVEKVVWFFSQSEKCIVATAQESWLIQDWDVEVSIIDGLSINMKKLLARKSFTH